MSVSFLLRPRVVDPQTCSTSTVVEANRLEQGLVVEAFL
jgi:hypothetical protein